jgi:hypothetical protein
MTLYDILEQVKQLNPQERRELVQQVLAMPNDEIPSSTPSHLTVFDLMAMPLDERQRVIEQAFAHASHEIFEEFEAFDEMDFNDDAILTLPFS